MQHMTLPGVILYQSPVRECPRPVPIIASALISDWRHFLDILTVLCLEQHELRVRGRPAREKHDREIIFPVLALDLPRLFFVFDLGNFCKIGDVVDAPCPEALVGAI